MSHNVLTTEPELMKFISYINAKHADKLKYSEFLQLILPNKKKRLR
jgi:hypothetical protein